MLCTDWLNVVIKLVFKITKYGDPNGVVHFDGVAQTTRTVDEPVSGSTKLQFPLLRQEGTMGNIQVTAAVFKCLRIYLVIK